MRVSPLLTLVVKSESYKHAEAKLVVHSRISEVHDYYSVCNFCCNPAEKLLCILILHSQMQKNWQNSESMILYSANSTIAWLNDHSLCNFLFGFSMLCDSTIAIHYIVNIIRLFSSLFGQFFNICWTHDFVLYLLWTVITIAWFQELHGVDEVWSFICGIVFKEDKLCTNSCEHV